MTTANIASSSMPLTTFEAYDVENSTVENVTLEFIDLPTTEAVSSTASVLQYLETASYKQGTHFNRHLSFISKTFVVKMSLKLNFSCCWCLSLYSN